MGSIEKEREGGRSSRNTIDDMEHPLSSSAPAIERKAYFSKQVTCSTRGDLGPACNAAFISKGFLQKP
ncbi:hypothetical protein L2E82_04239 [Cichorium intybus]|uniref:Uncharacterized protein n=1 Tax=Cichorium intybus TaxID=13427 RepID=A0ACB9H7C4_CICIN|nr:hypothetical protein L2E82_04239 [Cichorium intybus]